MNPRLILLFCLHLGLGPGLVACGSSDHPDAPSGVNDAGSSEFPELGALQFTYSPIYSAFVEGHPAQLPVQLLKPSLRNKGATFSSSDPTIAVVEHTADGAMVTVKKDGVVAIRVALDGETGSVRLVIKKFTEAQWLTGESRYANRDRALISPDSGVLSVAELINPAARNPNGACSTCHSAQAEIINVEDTPTQTAGYNDQELITVFSMGSKPEWWVQQETIPSFLWGKNHSWTVTEEEKLGLVAYLRTKTPKTQPPTVDSAVTRCGTASEGSPVLCDRNGNPVTVPTRRDAGAGATPSAPTDAGVRGGMDGGMATDAG